MARIVGGGGSRCIDWKKLMLKSSRSPSPFRAILLVPPLCVIYFHAMDTCIHSTGRYYWPYKCIQDMAGMASEARLKIPWFADMPKAKRCKKIWNRFYVIVDTASGGSTFFRNVPLKYFTAMLPKKFWYPVFEVKYIHPPKPFPPSSFAVWKTRPIHMKFGQNNIVKSSSQLLTCFCHPPCQFLFLFS